jgi:hypothetical protein
VRLPHGDEVDVAAGALTEVSHGLELAVVETRKPGERRTRARAFAGGTPHDDEAAEDEVADGELYSAPANRSATDDDLL